MNALRAVARWATALVEAHHAAQEAEAEALRYYARRGLRR